MEGVLPAHVAQLGVHLRLGEEHLGDGQVAQLGGRVEGRVARVVESGPIRPGFQEDSGEPGADRRVVLALGRHVEGRLLPRSAFVQPRSGDDQIPQDHLVVRFEGRLLLPAGSVLVVLRRLHDGQVEWSEMGRVRRAEVHIHPDGEEKEEPLEIAVKDPVVEERPAFGVVLLRHGRIAAEDGRGRFVVLDQQGGRERRLARPIDGVEVDGWLAEEELDDAGLVALDGRVERSLSIRIARVDLGAVLQQSSGRLFQAPGGALRKGTENRLERMENFNDGGGFLPSGEGWIGRHPPGPFEGY